MLVRNPAALGAVIRDRRRALGLEQRALAEKVGVSRHWVIDVEKGRPGCEIGLVMRALRVLGIALIAQPVSEQPASTIVAANLDAIIDGTRKPRS